MERHPAGSGISTLGRRYQEVPLELGTPIRALPAVGTPQAHPQPQPPVLGPSLSREEATGKVELELFPLLWSSAGSFGAVLEVLVPAGQRGSEGSPPRAVPSRIHGLTQSIPQEDQAADPAAHPSSVAQELLTSAGAARQPLGIPTGRKITPK